MVTLDVTDSLSAAFVHLRDLLYTFFAQPVCQLGNRDHHRIVLLADFNRVADVVEVAVGAEHDIHSLEVLLLRRTGGIAHDPRVHDDALAGRSLNAEGRVAQPGKLDSVQIHLRPSVKPALSSWQWPFKLQSVHTEHWLFAKCQLPSALV